MVTANIVPPLGRALAKGTITQKELIEKNFAGVCQENGALPGSISRKWSKWNEYDCLDFSYISNGYLPHDLLAYHIGRAIFVCRYILLAASGCAGERF